MVLFPGCRLVPVVGARIASWVQFNMGRCLLIGFSYRAGYLKQDVGPPRGLVPLRFRVYLQSFEPLEVLLRSGRVESSRSGTGLSALLVVAPTLCLPPPAGNPVSIGAGGTPGLVRDGRLVAVPAYALFFRLPAWFLLLEAVLLPALRGCSPSGRAQADLPAWLPPRPRFVRGGTWVPVLLVRLSCEVSCPGGSAAAFGPASWPSGDRALSGAVTGSSRQKVVGMVYPRIRGVSRATYSPSTDFSGSSPRPQGLRFRRLSSSLAIGSIPASAGSSLAGSAHQRIRLVHPRVRGVSRSCPRRSRG